MEESTTVAVPVPKGLNLDDVKNGIKRLLPVVKPIARLTPNKFDDALVLFLEHLLNDEN